MLPQDPYYAGSTTAGRVATPPPLPLQFAVSQWYRDPYSLGAWSLLTPDATPATRQTLQLPILIGGTGAGGCWLAGEYTNPSQAGMVHGAYQEGVRAAHDCVLALCGSQSNSNNNHNHQTNDDDDDTSSNCQRSMAVVVIGAGAAGLGCARTLVDDLGGQHKVTVLEARNRIGGRVRTERLVSSAHATTTTNAVELGANWLQQGDSNPLYQLAKKLELEMVETDFLKPDEYPTCRFVAPERVDAVMQEFVRRSHHKAGRYVSTSDGVPATGQHDRTPPTFDDCGHETRPRSVQDVVDDWFQQMDEIINLNEHDFSKDEIRHVLEGELMIDAGVPLSQLSSQFGMEPGVGEGDRWLVNGYSQLLEQMAVDLNIQKECVVTRIDTSNPDGVCVTYTCGIPGNKASPTETKQLHADAVICTVPCAVLQNGGIEFVPPLPESHRRALAALTTGRVEKIVLRFAERWWPPAVESNGYLRAFGNSFGDVSEWLDCTDAFGGLPVITGIFSGPWVREIWKDGSSDYEIALKATEALHTAV